MFGVCEMETAAEIIVNKYKIWFSFEHNQKADSLFIIGIDDMPGDNKSALRGFVELVCGGYLKKIGYCPHGRFNLASSFFEKVKKVLDQNEYDHHKAYYASLEQTIRDARKSYDISKNNL